MNSTKSWNVRLYKDGDESGYMDLMKTAFPAYRCTTERWRWEFKSNPFGSIQVFSDSNGEIVGHMGLIFAPMKIGDQTVMGSQAVDLAVSEEFRGKGMFIAVGKELMRNAAVKGVPISYGVPNEPAFRGHLKYGWFYAARIPVLVKAATIKGLMTLQLLNFLRFVRRPRFNVWKNSALIVRNATCGRTERHESTSSGVQWIVRTVQSFDKRIDELWNDVESDYQLILIRSTQYLNWRYVDKPYPTYSKMILEKNGRIEGFIVLATETDQFMKLRKGYIVDVLAKSGGAMRYLFRSALDYFEEKKVDLVTCWMMRKNPYHNFLSEHGFAEDDSKLERLICRINTNDDAFKVRYHKAEKSWFFTMGDSDII